MANKCEGYVLSERLQKNAVERELVRNQLKLKKEQENLEEFKTVKEKLMKTSKEKMEDGSIAI
jgi:hypothetical protein